MAAKPEARIPRSQRYHYGSTPPPVPAVAPSGGGTFEDTASAVLGVGIAVALVVLTVADGWPMAAGVLLGVAIVRPFRRLRVAGRRLRRHRDHWRAMRGRP